MPTKGAEGLAPSLSGEKKAQCCVGSIASAQRKTPMWAKEDQGWERVGSDFGQIWSGILASGRTGHVTLEKL